MTFCFFLTVINVEIKFKMCFLELLEVSYDWEDTWWSLEVG